MVLAGVQLRAAMAIVTFAQVPLQLLPGGGGEGCHVDYVRLDKGHPVLPGNTGWAGYVLFGAVLFTFLAAITPGMEGITLVELAIRVCDALRDFIQHHTASHRSQTASGSIQ